MMREVRLINKIRKRAGRMPKGVKVGIGDDCAVLEYDSDNYLLWAADMIVEGTHFDVKKASYGRIGRKAVAVNISDIAAMGGVPKYVTVTLGIPPRMSPSDVRMLYNGIFRICGDYGIKIVGGDTNRSDKLVIDVSIMGFVGKDRLIRRSGARQGEFFLITGPVRDGRKHHLDFTPRLKEALFLSGRYKVSSMIDVSDGIAPDISRICAESGTGCLLYESAIPLSRGLSAGDALYHGESFELLFTMSGGEAEKLFGDFGSKKESAAFYFIGEVTSGREGMKLVDGNGRVKKLNIRGFRHL